MVQKEGQRPHETPKASLGCAPQTRGVPSHPLAVIVAPRLSGAAQLQGFNGLLPMELPDGQEAGRR